MAMFAKKKTPTEQHQVNADKHPQIQLVHDDAQGDYPKRTSGACGAARSLQGERVTCELDVHHGGDHSQGGRSWRPRSRDAEDIAAASK